ncbi:MAG: B12-binding domain-containing radical SAM protein [Thermoplasmata archaeon]|nr:MAG: B12-binding domain-containing radical SAM protein [Thermoplasmata archaeon]
MRILLVSPFSGKKRTLLYRFGYLPSFLSLQQIAAITPEKHEVEIVDEKFSDIDFDEEYDLVGISCLTCNAPRGYEIADKFRKRGVKVALGGYHPTVLPDEAKEHADAVVIGEAELTWPKLIEDLERGKKLKPFYVSEEFVDPKLIPPAKRTDDIPTSIAPIQATRGCPVGCKFCTVHRVEGRVHRTRPVENVIEEIQSIKCKYLFFVDASMTINTDYTKKLFKEMMGLNKRFDCYGNVNVLARDDKLLKLASEAGCFRWQVGFESVSQAAINSVGKRTNRIEEYRKAVKKIKDYGMMVAGLFMFGFDTDTTDVFDNTLEMLKELDLDTAAFAILTPYPGTAIFEELDKQNRILTKDWSKYNEGNVVFQPKNMTVEQLLEGIKKVATGFYSFSNAMRRCIGGSKNLCVYDFFSKFVRNMLFTRHFHRFLFSGKYPS